MTVLGLLAVPALSGCDTVGVLTFQEEQVIELLPEGLTAAHCGADGDDAVLQFSVLTSFDARMEPGRYYAAIEDELRPGQNFKAEDISIADGWFFAVGKDGRDVECESSDDCTAGAECRTPEEMGLGGYYYRPSGACVFPTRIRVTADPSFTHFGRSLVDDSALVKNENGDGRTVAFVLDNSSSLDGSDQTGVPDAEKATDPYQYRKVGLNQFMDGLKLTGEKAPKYEFSAFFANGQGNSGVFDISEAWLRTEASWESKAMANYPSPSGGSPIWETGLAAVRKIQDTGNALYRKTIVALTDGLPNSGSDEAKSAFSKQIAAASTSDIDLHWLDYAPAGSEIRTDYASMTRKTCGTYHLFESAAQIPNLMRNIAVNTESHWNAGLSFSTRLPEGQLFRLATTIVVKLGESAVAYEAQRISEQNETIDRRLLVMR